MLRKSAEYKEIDSDFYQQSPQLVLDFTQSPPHGILTSNESMLKSSFHNNPQTLESYEELIVVNVDHEKQKETNQEINPGNHKKMEYDIGSFAYNPSLMPYAQQDSLNLKEKYSSQNQETALDKDEPSSNTHEQIGEGERPHLWLEKIHHSQHQRDPPNSLQVPQQQMMRTSGQGHNFQDPYSALMSPISTLTNSGYQPTIALSMLRELMQSQNQRALNPTTSKVRSSIERSNQIQAEAMKFFNKKQGQPSVTNSFKSSSRNSNSSFDSSASLPSSVSTSKFNTQNLDEQISQLNKQYTAPFNSNQFNSGGLDGQGFQYQTFSENPTHPITTQQQYMMSSMSKLSDTIYSVCRNTSSKQVNLLNISKATPAFKKNKDQFQINSQGTQKTFSSNEQFLSQTSLNQIRPSLISSYLDQQQSENKEKELLETSEGVINQKKVENRQLVRKQPKVIQLSNSQIKKQVKINSPCKVTVKQDPIKSNVYHIFGRGSSAKQNQRISKQEQQFSVPRITKFPRCKSKDVTAHKNPPKSFFKIQKCETESDTHYPTTTKQQNIDRHIKEESKFTYLNTHSSKDGGPEIITSFIQAPNLRDHSNEPFYQSIPTMIKKNTSSCENSSNQEEDNSDTETYNSYDTSHCSTCQQHISQLQHQSMEKINENQINEGVVYSKNGIGFPNSCFQPIMTINNNSLSNQIRPGQSMTTTTASALSLQLHQKKLSEINKGQTYNNLLAQRKNGHLMKHRPNQDSLYKNLMNNQYIPISQPLSVQQNSKIMQESFQFNESQNRTQLTQKNSQQRALIQVKRGSVSRNLNQKIQGRNQFNLFATQINESQGSNKQFSNLLLSNQQKSATRLTKVKKIFWNDGEVDNETYGVQTTTKNNRVGNVKARLNALTQEQQLLGQAKKQLQNAHQLKQSRNVQVIHGREASNNVIFTTNSSQDNSKHQYSQPQQKGNINSKYLNQLNQYNKTQITQNSPPNFFNYQVCKTQPDQYRQHPLQNPNKRYIYNNESLTEINQSSSGQESSSCCSYREKKKIPIKKKSSNSLQKIEQMGKISEGFSQNPQSQYICCYSTKSKPNSGCQIF